MQLRGVRPFFSDKFDITKHPNYRYLSDADPKNAFDMEKHIKRRPAIVTSNSKDILCGKYVPINAIQAM